MNISTQMLPDIYVQFGEITSRKINEWTFFPRALPIYKELNNGDTRPRSAINRICVFTGGRAVKRSAKLCVLVLDAYLAALDT